MFGHVLLIFSILFTISSCYKILVVFSHEGKSHQLFFQPVVKELVQKGHQITSISHYSLNIKNDTTYNEILLHNENSGENAFELERFNLPKRIISAIGPIVLTDMGLKDCNSLFSNPRVQSLISDGKIGDFDLIISEFFNSECSVVFPFKFKAPMIGFSSSTLMPWHSFKLGQPDNPSYISNNQLFFGKNLNFFERVENFVFTLLWKGIYWVRINENRKLSEDFLGETIPNFNEFVNNASLMLLNSHFSLSFARPNVPGAIEIGGVHLDKTTKKKLPQNIEKFINESTHGVIYFSLGSMIKGHTFPQEKREEFLKAFARLPQRVLWKWENETMPGKPDNVMIQKWMPQFDILSHPNVKAFISHGGLLGTTEAVHCGVPMIVMPQYGDQHTNGKAVEANGGGVILYLQEATEEKVYNSLKTILDPEFKKKAEALSERFRDRPMSPMDTAVYWVEYVARHKGAPHLRTAAVDMPLYQYLLLDVFAFLAVVIFLILFISYKITRMMLNAVFSKKKLKQN